MIPGESQWELERRRADRMSPQGVFEFFFGEEIRAARKMTFCDVGAKILSAPRVPDRQIASGVESENRRNADKRNIASRGEAPGDCDRRADSVVAAGPDTDNNASDLGLMAKNLRESRKQSSASPTRSLQEIFLHRLPIADQRHRSTLRRSIEGKNHDVRAPRIRRPPPGKTSIRSRTDPAGSACGNLSPHSTMTPPSARQSS